jgi:uncharacterized protein (TIGR03435 family)
VYALVVWKNGPKLANSGADTRPSLMMNRGHIEAKHAQTVGFVKMLGGFMGRSVVDQTGLTGDYDFTLDWAPDPGDRMVPKGIPVDPGREKELAASMPDGPSLFTAIQEQLGLKLESKRGPVEILVIDAVGHPSEN